MDYYQLLRVSSQASTKEIEEAYQRLIKESRYDTTIELRDIHTAYRVLSDPKQKAAYDNIKRVKETQNVAYTTTIKRRKKGRKLKLTLKQKVYLMIAVIVIATAYFVFRFGYIFNDFQAGDVLYMDDSNTRVGIVLKYESEHNFGPFYSSAYLIKTEHGDVWYQAGQVKMRCHKAGD